MGKSDKYNAQIEAINDAFNTYKNAVKESEEGTDLFKDCIKDTSAEFKNYVDNLNLASVCNVENHTAAFLYCQTFYSDYTAG